MQIKRELPCPSWGFVKLTTKMGKEHVMRTACKTWRCSVCRTRLVSLFKMRVLYGCLTLGESYLITVTLKAGQESIKDAGSVRLAWERLLRSLKERSPNLAWLKVIELTQLGTPHLHLIVGGLGRRVPNCQKGRFRYSEAAIRAKCKKDCLIHEWSKEWWRITGHSYVVDARLVYAPEGIGGYLAKYLTKAFNDRVELERLGFKRRWACSRNFPREAQIQTLGTVEHEWESVEIIPRYFRREHHEWLERRYRNSHWLTRVGDDLGVALRQASKTRMAVSKLERMLKSAENIQTYT